MKHQDFLWEQWVTRVSWYVGIPGSRCYPGAPGKIKTETDWPFGLPGLLEPKGPLPGPMGEKGMDGKKD
ncbi:unnamed protein product [Cercopithifilaria johnstoni]|uniref:Uncharacterized protein n=1 Tax=Cercopithifilaria johnstoni TaxID=2874296 RepID=A0A8J2Q088_9BILA|nr:unnamed protein product [Cercopithifilaria johnstoni]